MCESVEAAIAGQSVIWGAPTFDQCRVGFLETYRAAADVARFNRSLMTVDFPNGGRILFRSLDNPDNARGHTADGVVIDEIADVNPIAWYEVLRPMLMDTGGWFLGIGTPKGRNWVYLEFEAAKERADAAICQAPTLGCRITPDGQLVREPHPLENPDIPFSELQDMYRTMPERSFRQEVLAEFLEDGGGVFRRVREAATAQPLEQPEPNHNYVFGVDWGRSEDWTAISVIDATTMRQVCLDRFNQVDYRLQRGRLLALAQRFKPSAIVAEANSIGQPNIEELVSTGLWVQPFITTNATKAHIIDQLTLAFEQGTLTILNDAVQTGELLAYSVETLPVSRLRRYGAPEGQHDDTVMALALAYEAAVGGRVTLGAALP